MWGIRKILAFLVLLMSIGSVSLGVVTAQDDTVFRVIEPVAYRAAGMLATPSERAGHVVDLLWLPLVGGDTNAQPVPTGLAESWEVAADNMSVVFTLRQDAKFSDGSPITAADAAWSINYQIMSGHPDIYGQHDFFPARREYANIVGAQEVFDGGIPADEFGAADVAGIIVVDDYTLRIEFTQPTLFMLNNLQFARIAKAESVLASAGKTYADDAYWTTESGTVFSGPFMLESFTSGSGMTLVPNPYWFGAAPTVSRVESIFVQDLSSGIAAFENGEAEVIDFTMTPIDVANLASSEYLQSSLVSYPSLSVVQLFVTPFRPMDDVHVRRAISMAIDRQALTNVLGGGEGQATYQVLSGHFAPANVNCADQFASVVGMPYDPAAAQAELALSPYAADIATMPLNMQLGMFGMPLSQDLIIAQVVQAMLQQNLGITVNIQSSPIADFNAPPYPTHLWPNEQGDHFIDQMAFMNNLASLNSADPLPDEAQMGMVTTPRVPELLDLMAQAAAATDITSRCELLAQAQQVWVDQVYTIDLFTLDSSMLIAPYVEGEVINNFGGSLSFRETLEGLSYNR